MRAGTEKRFEVDLLHGPILKAMLVFAVPLFFSGVFQQLYNTMDTVIIGHTLVQLFCSLASIAWAIL